MVKPRYARFTRHKQISGDNFVDHVLRASCIREEVEIRMPGKQDTSHKSSHGTRKWSAGVNTDSTHPQPGLFNQDAKTIARELSSKRVSPKGPSSGMRMLTFYINRAGRNLPATRLKVLEEAKVLLHRNIVAGENRQKKGTGSKRAA
jgi:hypothetical protein